MSQDFWNTAERMNPTVKDIWVKALRSGDFTQGRGALGYKRQADGQWCFCPIGVLTELAIRAGVRVEVLEFPIPDNHRASEYHLPDAATFVKGYDWITTGLIGPVAKWAGLDMGNTDVYLCSMLPQWRHEGWDVTVIRANDEQKLTFDQIADLIDFFL